MDYSVFIKTVLLAIVRSKVYYTYYGRRMQQGRPLYFCPVISIFLFSSFFLA